MFPSKVKLQNEALSWYPSCLLHVHSVSYLQPPALLQSCVSELPDLTGSYRLLQATCNVPFSYGPANSTGLTSGRNCSDALCARAGMI